MKFPHYDTRTRNWTIYEHLKPLQIPMQSVYMYVEPILGAN